MHVVATRLDDCPSGKSVTVSIRSRAVLHWQTSQEALRVRTNFISHFNAIWVVQIARQK
jgi:hypothetical protein